MKTLLNTLLLAALATVAARGDIMVVFDHPDQTGQPADTLQFFGVISNTGAATVFLNSDNLNLAGNDFTVNDLFFANVPLSLDAGLNSGDIELFDVTIKDPLSDPAGKFQGQYSLVGGIDGNAQDSLASVDFSVTTSPLTGTVTTPEPTSLALLGAITAALILSSKKIRT